METAYFSFSIIAKDELVLPPYKGSAFRGLFGHALRKTVCVTNMLSCEGCLLRQNCAYAYIFETFNKRNERVARPFIIEPPLSENRIFPPGDELKINLYLFGKAIDYLPYIVYTFREMGKKGLGKKQGKFRLKEVKKDDYLVYDYHEQLVHTDFERDNLFAFEREEIKRVLVRFITPSALKVNGRVSRAIDFPVLLKAVARRVKALSYYHNGKTDDFYHFDLEKAKDIRTVQSALEPYCWKRYSNRQQQEINFDGFIGSLEFAGDLSPFIPLLRMGEVVHVGRGTVYGMGKYLIEVKED